MSKEVMDRLALKGGETVLDATVGLGGHSKLILEAIGPTGHLIAFDRDARNLDEAKNRLSDYASQITFIHDSFGNVANHAMPPLDAALFDLGFSSVHVDDPARGFSFQSDGPLDMRYDQTGDMTAATIVNEWGEDELAEIFRIYGEELLARPIAQAICEAREQKRFETTTELADVVSLVKPRRGRIHPATQIFQALRIAVNGELTELERALESMKTLLKPNGRLCIITFHSLEDRIVKQEFKKEDFKNAELIKPSHEEIAENPRARSAKLRFALKN